MRKKIYVHTENVLFFTTYKDVHRYLIKADLYTSHGYNEKERLVRGLKIISKELKDGGFHVVDSKLRVCGGIYTHWDYKHISKTGD